MRYDPASIEPKWQQVWEERQTFRTPTDPAVLAALDVIGIGPDLHWTADRAGGHRVPVGIKAHQTGAGDGRRDGMEAVEGAGIRHQTGLFRLKGLPDRPIAVLRVSMRLRISDALIKQPGIQLVIALHPQPWREEALAQEPDLVFHLALLPT